MRLTKYGIILMTNRTDGDARMKIINDEQAYTALTQFMMWFDKNPNIKNEILDNIKFDVFDYLNREIENRENTIDRHTGYVKWKMEEKAKDRKWDDFVMKYENSLSNKQLAGLKKHIKNKDLSNDEISLITDPKLSDWKMERMAYCIDKGFSKEQWALCFNNKYEQDKVLYLTEAVINKVDDDILKILSTPEMPTAIIGMYVLGIVDKVSKDELFEKLISPNFTKKEVIGLRNYVKKCYKDYALPNRYKRCTWQLASVIEPPELDDTITCAKNLSKENNNVEDIIKEKEVEIYT